jgi:putative ABC transport system substrate-binding protein
VLGGLGVAAIVAQEPNAVRAAAGVGAIPVVMAGGSEVPVERGFVAGLARPGGAVTGVSYGTPELPAKRLELLKEAVPDLTRVAFIGGEPEPIGANPKVSGIAAAARALGLRLELVSLRTADDFTPRDFGEVFAELARKRVGAFVMDASALAADGRPRLAALAIRQRLPSIWGSSLYKDAALLAYGANLLDVWRRAAAHVDKLLKGANPADLPVELPTEFDFIVNLTTARALGMAVPASVLQQATEVVQ